jgi:hypothetical protein
MRLADFIGAPNSPVRLFVTSDAAEVRLEVKDSGEAVNRLRLEMVFDPLRRGTDREPRRGAGGSLGLYIARAIVKGHWERHQRAVGRDRDRVCDAPTAPQLAFRARSAPISALGGGRQMMQIGGLIGQRVEHRDQP